jgi:O-antigen/teichoic acid export membrane protein
MEKQKSYNQIAKATGIFGGVQVFNILLSIIRSKVVAVLLGTTGVGLMGMFTATTTMIASITNLGIGFSAVRTVSEATASNDQTIIGRTLLTLRRWVIVTGLLGALICIVFSRQLSIWTFGSTDYTWAFIWLSVTLLLQALTSGQLALLQGMRKLQQLAKANILGSFLGLCVSLPAYYWLGEKGIVPALILTAVTNLFLSWYFTSKIEVAPQAQTLQESFRGGLEMVKLGSVVMITGFATAGVMYLIRMFISRTGGLEQVGLYSAAWAILNGYVDMVFTAMGTDYFPRLSAVNSNNKHMRQLVNEQAEMGVLILGPILVLLLCFLPLVIRILLTQEFLPIANLIEWALIGILFKAGSWSIAFTMLAKGDKKMFFISETTATIIMLGTTVLFYRWFQLPGIGMAFLLSYVLYLGTVYTIARLRYEFSFDRLFLKLFAIQLFFTVSTFLVINYTNAPVSYLLCTILTIATCSYSFYELNKRLDLQTILTNLKAKFSK